MYVPVMLWNINVHSTHNMTDWPYCAAARRLSSITMTSPDGSSWDKFEWRRQLETFGDDDEPMIASGPRGNVDSIWWVAILSG